MVQPGTVILRVVVKGVVVFGGTSQGAVEKGGKGGGQSRPTIKAVIVARARPVLRRVWTAVPITGNEGKTKGVEGMFVKGIKKTTTDSPVGRSVQIRDRENAATDRHLGADQTIVVGKGMGKKGMGRVEQEADIIRPHGWASPDLRPKVSVLIRGVCFLKADNIRLALSAEEIIESAAGIWITETRTVQRTYR